MHLRVGDTGGGVLTVDASRVIHLNPVAADMAFMGLSGYSEKEMLRSLKIRYNVKKKQALSDLAEFSKAFEKLLKAGASEPVSFVNMDVSEPFQTKVEVPYRMDLALTYRCNLNCGHCYNQTRQKEELSTEQWKQVMKRIWDLGIPHVIFTGERQPSGMTSGNS